MADAYSDVETSSDFSNAVYKLEPSGSNWMMFRRRFHIAAKQKRVWGQFDGSNKMPTLPDKCSPKETQAYRQRLALWQDNEDLAMYLLTQQLPNSIFAKYMRKNTVAEMWAAIVKEFTQVMRPNLHSEFMAMRYEKGADLRAEFDRVRMKYEMLLDAGIEVSEDNYRTLIINFVPPELSSFLPQLSASVKMLMTQKMSALSVNDKTTKGSESGSAIVVDAESLMQLAVEEWDRREATRKTNKVQGGSSAAMATVSSERPEATTGGGRRNRKILMKLGECWNCGGRGHQKSDCPSPRAEKKDW